MRLVKRLAKICNPQSSLGRQIFTALGYAVLNATSKKSVDTLLGILEGAESIKKAKKFYPKSALLSEYERMHVPKCIENIRLLKNNIPSIIH